MKGMRRREHLLWVFVAAVVLPASPAPAAERELDRDPPPSSAKEIETPIERVFPEVPVRPPLFPWFREKLQELPPFFADTQLEARYRTYYLRKDRTIDVLSEAWAMGGSVYYRSGWLLDHLQLEAEGFTSQPIIAPEDRDGTLLLAPGQQGYSVLGIANGKLRLGGLVLTGYRQYLDLPYVNRQDNRMTPNTFEAITLVKPEGRLRFSTGYSWRIKLRNSDKFTNHLYVAPNGRTAKAVVALNRGNEPTAVTISLADPIDGVSCVEQAQALWGPKAGGHLGIAGSPRDREMTEDDLHEAARVMAQVIG